MHLKPCQVSMLYPLRTQCGDGDGDFDFDSEPPPSSLISTGDGDAGVMTSMLSNVPMFTADNCLMAMMHRYCTKLEYQYLDTYPILRYTDTPPIPYRKSIRK